MKDALHILRDAAGPIRYGMTNDYMFRAVLQRSDKTLRHILAALLCVPYEEITSCEILNPIALGDAIDDKTCIMDVRVRMNNNRLINLEMQVGNLENWPSRALFYLCRLFCNIGSGQDYSKILPSVHIGILSRSPFADMTEFYSEYFLKSERNNHIFSRIFSLRMLNLDQIEKVSEEERATDLYYWARMFKAETWEDIRMLAEKNSGIAEAAGHLRILSEDEKVRQQCEGRERYQWDMNTAKSEGIEQGMQRMAELTKCLLAEKRFEELERAATDSSYREELLKQYRIS